MNIDINLAKNKDPNDLRKEKIKKLKNLSIALLALTAFLALVIFGLDYRFSASYVKNQEANLLKVLEAYDEDTAKLFIVNTKLQDISKLLTKRNNFDEKIDKILAGSPESISIQEFTIDEKGIEMEATTNSLTDVDDFLNYLIKLSDEDELSSITLKSLKLEKDEYILELVLI